MINLNDMPEEFYNFIFGNVVIEEFLPNITVECTYIDEVKLYGRIIIDKELNKIILLLVLNIMNLINMIQNIH